MDVSITHLWSISRVAAQLSITVDRVRQVADEMGLAPDLNIDDVPYFGYGKVHSMRCKLNPDCHR